jgi:hypothetical protein
LDSSKTKISSIFLISKIEMSFGIFTEEASRALQISKNTAKNTINWVENGSLPPGKVVL